MKPHFAPALAILLAAACRAPEPFGASRRAALAHGITQNWSEASRLTAERLIDKYGPPDAIAAGALAWKGARPFKRIVLWDEPLGPGLEETVPYGVPQDRRKDLEALGGLVWASPDGMELTAQSDAESSNFLALNIADDILRGRTSPSRGRQAFDRTLSLSASGKSSRYMEGLMFSTGDAP